MKEINKIIMVTDGSVIKYKGLLGFLLTTADGKVLLSCYGQPARQNPYLFYSEACTFLSATRLVFLIAENYNELIVDSIDILSKISLFTDSMSMIKKLNSMDAYPTAHLKTVMDSERYILQALRGLMEQLDERI